jgi:hypothetical protein
MFAQGFRGIVVANAKDELKRGHTPTIYQPEVDLLREFKKGWSSGWQP